MTRSARAIAVIVATAPLVAPLVASQADAPQGRPVPNRDYIAGRLAELRRIHTPEGIETLEPVEIGGMTQWVSIRGRHRENPVILFIHGGPGTPMMPMTWAYQAPWEDFFTVVQWDQRGVGKNAATTDQDALVQSLSNDRIVEDAVEMLAWVRTRLKKDKVVVMGYSYGTRVGMAVAQRRTRPDNRVGACTAPQPAAHALPSETASQRVPTVAPAMAFRPRLAGASTRERKGRWSTTRVTSHVATKMVVTPTMSK